MPDAKILDFNRPRRYACSFATSSDAAVAHVAASFGVQLDVRIEPTDSPEPSPPPVQDLISFSGDNVRLDAL
jgi:hypothetical protein